MTTQYIVTGNETVSLPTIREIDGSIEGISLLHMGAKGMLELCGDDGTPFLQPFIEVEDKSVPITDFQWNLEHYWIPTFKAKAGSINIQGTILAPIGERGFCYRISVENDYDIPVSVRFGVKGYWNKTLHSINESKEIQGEMKLYKSGWNHCFVCDLRLGYSLFAFAPIYTETPETSDTDYSCNQEEDGSIRYECFQKKVLAPRDVSIENYWFGLGFEEVAASTSAKEMLRHGFEVEHRKTCDWLAKRERNIKDERLNVILNRNMFFSFFFGSGITLDTEELVLVTSRSPRYYVSAAYWDRDSLLWSFPAILMADVEYAREILHYVFTKQIKNVGIHSRYIDGTVLEPGFELDELCAPVIALAEYVKASGDYLFIEEAYIQAGIKRILKILQSKRHNEIALYETFLQPTDDMHVYPFLTYDNVLVWKILLDIAELYSGKWDKGTIRTLTNEAKNVKESIEKHCIKIHNGIPIYAWSVDLCGNWDIYDEPPGSLLLLPHYGYCQFDDKVWNNTVNLIRSRDYKYSFADCPIAEIGCAHAPHPWVLSIANSLLSGNALTAREHLLKCSMDNGIACESVDEYTGESRTGDAFATCAGFLAYAINKAFSDDNV
ncbi:MAG: metal-independent alpha-mannosidase [Anaerolineaceae bacterium]|nr:MAG: metal-independent alpha-mannosidase [Anaerolineaceae bacterium]